MTTKLSFTKSAGLLLSVVASLCIGNSANAGFAQGNNVTLGSEIVFSIPCSADGFSPEHRAWLAQDALDNALAISQNLSPTQVHVERINGAPVVMFGQYKIVTADGASADFANLPADELANKWAASLRRSLSDQEKTERYVIGLRGKHPVQGSVAIVERQLYAPAGTVLPVVFVQTSNEGLNAGDYVEAKVTKDVSLGHYVIPEDSVVIGRLEAGNDPSALRVVFHRLRTPYGTEKPIEAVAYQSYITGSIPHPVCTLGIPAGQGTAYRVPATVAIGASGEAQTTTLVFQKGVSQTALAGQPASVVFETVTPVAVITRDVAM